MHLTKVPEHFYDQSAVIPFRERNSKVEVLLISSRKKKRWVIPKGVKEPALSSRDSAAKEALEEAGIEGIVYESPLGTYQYNKWGGVCTVEVFAMKVEKVHERWEEDYRERQWVSLKKAAKWVSEKDLKDIIQAMPRRLATSNAVRS